MVDAWSRPSRAKVMGESPARIRARLDASEGKGPDPDASPEISDVPPVDEWRYENEPAYRWFCEKHGRPPE